MKTIFSALHPGGVIALVICAALGALALFLKFGIPGYSFSALVCLCLMGLILFYVLMPLVGLRFPQFARVVTRMVTVLVMLGFLVVSLTEMAVIHASRGHPEEPVDYMVVLGAKVNADGPSVSLWDRICGAYTYLEEHPTWWRWSPAARAPTSPSPRPNVCTGSWCPWASTPIGCGWRIKPPPPGKISSSP